MAWSWRVSQYTARRRSPRKLRQTNPRQSEHQEVSGCDHQEAFDREPACGDAHCARQTRCRSRAAQACPRGFAEDTPGALRRGQAAQPTRPDEDEPQPAGSSARPPVTPQGEGDTSALEISQCQERKAVRSAQGQRHVQRTRRQDRQLPRRLQARRREIPQRQRQRTRAAPQRNTKPPAAKAAKPPPGNPE